MSEDKTNAKELDQKDLESVAGGGYADELLQGKKKEEPLQNSAVTEQVKGTLLSSLDGEGSIKFDPNPEKEGPYF